MHQNKVREASGNPSTAKEALFSQQAFTSEQNEIAFHNSRTSQPWKDDQAIRKIIWTPSVKKADVKYRNPNQTRHTFASIHAQYDQD